MTMQWVSAHSRLDTFDAAWAEVRASIYESLGDSTNVLILYVSYYFRDHLSDVGRYVRASFPGAVVIGASSEGVLAAEYEYDDGPTIAAVAAHHPVRTDVTSLYLPSEAPACDAALASVDWHSVNGAVLLCDPHHSDGDRILNALQTLAPGLPVVGGEMGGCSDEPDYAVWTEEGVFDDGAVLLLLRGSLGLHVMSAPNNRLIGEPLIVMEVHGGVIVDAFDRGRPMDVVTQLVPSFPEGEAPADATEPELAVFYGGAEIDAEDGYVTRAIGGVHKENGSMLVAGKLEQYQVVQFALPIPKAAQKNLAIAAQKLREELAHEHPVAVLSFVSMARGIEFYHQPDSDVSVLSEALDLSAHVGIFANGEYAPLGDRLVSHTGTATVGVIVDRSARPR